MAELNNTSNNTTGKRSFRKFSPKVDMTPMVDLMFLLITFFMLTTTLSKKSAINIAMPVGKEPSGISEDRTLNLCLGKNDNIQYYLGNDKTPQDAPAVSSIRSPQKNLRKILNTYLLETKKKSQKNLIVLIKPSDKSSYHNLVDVLDEIEITGIKTYMIVDTSPADIQRMTAQQIY